MRGISAAMQSVEDLFVKFGGPTAFANAIGIKLSAASEMRRRASIPVRYWHRLVMAGKQNGIKITFDHLVDMHSDVDQRNSRRRA
jgi:hypothetical protein